MIYETFFWHSAAKSQAHSSPVTGEEITHRRVTWRGKKSLFWLWRTNFQNVQWQLEMTEKIKAVVFVFFTDRCVSTLWFICLKWRNNLNISWGCYVVLLRREKRFWPHTCVFDYCTTLLWISSERWKTKQLNWLAACQRSYISERIRKKKLWQDGRPSVVSWKQNISSNSVCLRENMWRTLCDLVQQVSVLASNAMSPIFCIILCPLYNNQYFSPVIICPPTIGIPLPPFHILLFSRCNTFWLSSI